MKIKFFLLSLLLISSVFSVSVFAKGQPEMIQLPDGYQLTSVYSQRTGSEVADRFLRRHLDEIRELVSSPRVVVSGRVCERAGVCRTMTRQDLRNGLTRARVVRVEGAPSVGTYRSIRSVPAMCNSISVPGVGAVSARLWMNEQFQRRYGVYARDNPRSLAEIRRCGWPT